jgi:alkyldihydroxyacetonephosphate synthase
VILDEESLLVEVDARVELRALETELSERGLTLDIGDDARGTVGMWLGDGAPGARSAWLDPADHLVAGFTASACRSKERVAVPPAPRRAVGPDLLALVMGAKGRFLVLESVWLRVHRKDAPRPSTEPFAEDNEPPNDGERALFDAIDAAL